jgi:hypothetical protein
LSISLASKGWKDFQSCLTINYYFLGESKRSSCGCGSSGGDSSFALPILLSALFFATSFLNQQIIMAGGKRKKRHVQLYSPILDPENGAKMAISAGKKTIFHYPILKFQRCPYALCLMK